MKAGHAMRDMLARQAVLRGLAAAHDRFSEEEQQLRLIGKDVEAEGAHVVAVRILRAYTAEMDDPNPRFIE